MKCGGRLNLNILALCNPFFEHIVVLIVEARHWHVGKMVDMILPWNAKNANPNLVFKLLRSK